MLGDVGVVVVVVVVVMDACITELWMQYKVFFTYPSDTFLLFGTASCSRDGKMEFMIHIFSCLFRNSLRQVISSFPN